MPLNGTFVCLRYYIFTTAENRRNRVLSSVHFGIRHRFRPRLPNICIKMRFSFRIIIARGPNGIARFGRYRLNNNNSSNYRRPSVLWSLSIRGWPDGKHNRRLPFETITRVTIGRTIRVRVKYCNSVWEVTIHKV